MKLITAFGLAPIGAISVYAFLLFYDPLNDIHFRIQDLIILAPVVVFAYLTELLLALPLFLILKRINRINLSTCLLSGLILGAATGVYLDMPVIQLKLNNYYIVSSVAGLLSGAVFAFIYLTRPNQAL